MTDNAGQQL